jgi:hypothetical protein
MEGLYTNTVLNLLSLISLKKLDDLKPIERTASSYGPIHRMYESTRPLMIVVPQKKSYDHVALQIAHDWYLYGGGDATIVYDNDNDTTQGRKAREYRVYLGLANENKRIDQIMANRSCGIEFERNASSITAIKVGDKVYRSPGTGTIKKGYMASNSILISTIVGILFMQPGLQEGEVAVIISGIDSVGFDSACRLLPKRTGMMIPEWSKFLVVTRIRAVY